MRDGPNLFLYVAANPIWYFDSNGLGKEGGQPDIGGNDPLIDKSIGKNSTPGQVQEQIKKIEDALKSDSSIPKKRAARLRAWMKVAKRGFSRMACPPLLEDFTRGVAGMMCQAGDLEMCDVFIPLGGEIESTDYSM